MKRAIRHERAAARRTTQQSANPFLKFFVHPQRPESIPHSFQANPIRIRIDSKYLRKPFCTKNSSHPLKLLLIRH
jgi:hypothetical protein